MSEETIAHSAASMTDDAFLSSFVPDLAAELASVSTFDAPTSTDADLVMLYMDLDGFSRNCAYAVSKRDRDIDNFAAAISALFGDAFALIKANGGTVFSLAGDAVSAGWNVAHAPQKVAEAAVACAHALDDYIGKHRTPLFDTPVSASILLDRGSANLGVVGGYDDQWQAVLLGDVVHDLATHLRSAKAGRIVATRAFANMLENTLAVDSEDAAPYVDVFDPQTLVKFDPQPNSTLNSAPLALVPRLAASANDISKDWLSELRSATALFARRTLDDPQQSLSLDQLQHLVREFQDCVDGQGGRVVQVLADDKGLIFLAAWGLSSSMHEDNAARALRAGLRYNEEAAANGETLDVGLSSGGIYEGVIGSNIYRQFVIIGPAANRSASLAQIADGRVVADETTMQAASKKFEFSELAAVSIKGQANPERIFEPISFRAKPHIDRPRLIGRTVELAAADAAFGSVAADPSKRGLWVVGSPGMGKSHFAAELIQRAEQRGVRSVMSTAEVFDLSSDLQVWRHIFENLLDLTAPSARERKEVAARLEGVSDLDRRLPLLNEVTDLAFEPTVFSKNLTATQRRSEAIRFLADITAHLVGDGPLLLVLDDVQWIDTASWALLAAILQRCQKIDVLLVSREMDVQLLPREAQDLLNLRHMDQLRLSGLPQSETDALLGDVLQVQAIPEQISNGIHTRTEGHPYYSRELALDLLQRGVIHVSGGLCHVRLGLNDLESVDFPDNVQGAVRSRFSQMSVDVQITLKVASVLGRVIDIATLEQVHPDTPDQTDLKAYLETAQTAELVRPMPSGAYEFSHALTQGSIYSLLVADQRRMLHRSYAEVLEASDKVQQTASAALLSWHWQEAGELKTALSYLVQAADQARETQSHMETAKHLTRALELNGELGKPRSDQEIATWHQNLAQALFEMNQVHASITQFKSAVWLLLRDVRRPSNPAIGAIREFAILKTRGMKREPDENKRKRLLAAADCCIQLAFQHYEINELIHSMHYTFLAVNLAKMAGEDSEALARSNLNLSIASFSLPFALDGDRHLRYGMQIAQRSNDLKLKYWVHFTASSYNAAAGRYKAGIQDAKRASDISHTHMLPRDSEAADAQLAVSLRLAGAYRDSAAADQATIDSARARGVLQTQIWSLAGHLKSYMMLGDTAMQAEALNALRSLLSDPTARENCSASNFANYCMGEAFAAGEGDRRDDVAYWLVEAVETLTSISDPQVYMTDAPGYFSDALLLAWYRSGNDEYLRLCGSLRKYARKLAKLYPGARPLKHIVDGDYARMRGDDKAAARGWNKAVQVAYSANLPLEVARGSHRLAHADGSVSRPASLDELPHNIPYPWILLEKSAKQALS